MEARGRFNKEEHSSLEFWRSAISMKHQKLCSEFRLRPDDPHWLKEPEVKRAKAHDTDFSRMRQ